MIHTVTEHTLATGTKGLLIDVPGSEVIDIKLYFRAGYQFGDFTKYEIPHLIEHLILTSTKAFPENNQIGVQFDLNGAYHNASTGPSYIGYVAECAAFEVERIIDLLTEVVARPLFPEASYETERENVRGELNYRLSDYHRRANMLNDEANFPHEVMRYRQRLDQLDAITHADVVAYYDKTHQALNANFVVSGAVAENEELILRKLTELYGELPKGERKELRDTVGLGQPAPLVEAEEIDSLYFRLDWFNEGVSDRERAAGRLLTSILTGGYASRIYGKIRDAGLAYHIGSGQSVSGSASLVNIAGFCDVVKWEPILELVSTEIQTILKTPPSLDEVDAARNRIIGAVMRSNQTAGDVANWYTYEYLFDGSTLSYDDYFDFLRAVTPKEVQAMAKHYFASKRHSAALVGRVAKAESEAVAAKLGPIWP